MSKAYTMQSTEGIDAPLALKLRPRDFFEFVGQKDIVGPGTVLRKAIEEDTLSSAIFWGPPGCGKTTLAQIIAHKTKADFVNISAVTASVADVRRIAQEARERQIAYGQRTILLLDEVHRFNKAQQDALLPAVEDRTVILIGTTTENPYFEVNPALISRSRVFQFEALAEQELQAVLERALKDKERGLGGEKIRVEKDALDHLVSTANGDARSVLNALELAAATTVPDKGVKRITLPIAADAIQKKALLYDRVGDTHYETISAFIKSMRGSDPQAALYWLARMVYAGEDPRFIARRMVIFASEDVGNADPQALVIATSAAHAVEYVGLPEARLNLAQAAAYLATAPKSNAVIKGIDQALKDVAEKPTPPPPKHLRNPAHPGLRGHGYGAGYKYPHNYPEHWVEQDYLPEVLKGRQYYEPSDSGFEKEIKRRMGEIKKRMIKLVRPEKEE